MLKNALVKPRPKEPYKTTADNLDALVYMVLADADVTRTTRCWTSCTATARIWPCTPRRCSAWPCTSRTQSEKLDMILQNIEQFVVQDDENQTAYLKLPDDNYWWYWYGSEIEANALLLEAA